MSQHQLHVRQSSLCRTVHRLPKLTVSYTHLDVYKRQAFWFTISFITNILGPLIPDIIHNFNLSDLAMAGFIPTSFFLAYAIMSIPAGLLIDRFGEKPVLFCGFLMPFIGTILFACMHTYPMLLASSFIIGLGMAMLQTVLNPLQRTVGGEENYAFIAELAQFMFGIASFLSPLAYTCLLYTSRCV